MSTRRYPRCRYPPQTHARRPAVPLRAVVRRRRRRGRAGARTHASARLRPCSSHSLRCAAPRSGVSPHRAGAAEEAARSPFRARRLQRRAIARRARGGRARRSLQPRSCLRPPVGSASATRGRAPARTHAAAAARRQRGRACLPRRRSRVAAVLQAMLAHRSVTERRCPRRGGTTARVSPRATMQRAVAEPRGAPKSTSHFARAAARVAPSPRSVAHRAPEGAPAGRDAPSPNVAQEAEGGASVFRRAKAAASPPREATAAPRGTRRRLGRLSCAVRRAQRACPPGRCPSQAARGARPLRRAWWQSQRLRRCLQCSTWRATSGEQRRSL